MPVPLTHPATKHDIRLFDADVAFIRASLAQAGGSLTFHEWVRTLVNTAANEARAKVGLPKLE